MLSTILIDFACWSTVACVRNVAMSESKRLRIFWILVFIAMVVAFVIQLALIIMKYLSYPADIATKIVFSSQPFPEVTFCNYNPFKLSVVARNSDFAEINSMLQEYKSAEQGASVSNVFGFQGLDRFERRDRALDLLTFFSAKLTEAQKEPALYKIEEMVTECLFAGTTCDPGAIEVVSDPVYGRCFVYRGVNQTITRSGLAHGLRLILTSNLANSLTFESDFLPTTNRIGIRMTVNDEGSLISLDNHGFNIGVGFQTSVALSKSLTERAKPPYGICIDDMSNGTNYYSDLPYTMDSCLMTCFQKEIRCGCAHPMIRKSATDVWCSTSEHATCVASIRGNQLNSTNANVDELKDCGCKPPCKESSFSSTLSVLTYPAFSYTVGVGTTNQSQAMKEDQDSKTTTTSTTTTTTARSTTSSRVAGTTTTTACRKPAFYDTVMQSGLFDDISADICKPKFRCKNGVADKWWECWPCFYECGYDDERLPSSRFPTPEVRCTELFEVAEMDTGSNYWFAESTKRPAFNDWEDGQRPNWGECQAEKAKIDAPVIPITTFSPIDITDCNKAYAILDSQNTWAFEWNNRNSKPRVYVKENVGLWSDRWPCSYLCTNESRTPTNFDTVPAMKQFKCRDFFNCVDFVATNYSERPDFHLWNSGNGKINCDDLTTTRTPARKKRSADIDNLMGAPGKGSCESWNTNFKTVEDCKTWYKQNGMIVNVYFETLEYKVLTESASYSIPAAVNDLGGQAGLWLGLSVVSIVECIGLFFMIIMICITGKRMSVTPENQRPVENDGELGNQAK